MCTRGEAQVEPGSSLRILKPNFCDPITNLLIPFDRRILTLDLFAVRTWNNHREITRFYIQIHIRVSSVATSGILVQKKIILVLVHYQTAVSHRISSVLRECSYINSATLTSSLWKTVTVGKTFLPALSEFYANAHLETPEHSSSSSRIEQPTGRKDAFHIGLRCSGTGQVLNKPCKSWRTSGMPAFKGINTESAQLALQQCVCPAEKTHWQWQHHIW